MNIKLVIYYSSPDIKDGLFTDRYHLQLFTFTPDTVITPKTKNAVDKCDEFIADWQKKGFMRFGREFVGFHQIVKMEMEEIKAQ